MIWNILCCLSSCFSSPSTQLIPSSITFICYSPFFRWFLSLSAVVYFLQRSTLIAACRLQDKMNIGAYKNHEIIKNFQIVAATRDREGEYLCKFQFSSTAARIYTIIIIELLPIPHAVRCWVFILFQIPRESHRFAVVRVNLKCFKNEYSISFLLLLPYACMWAMPKRPRQSFEFSSRTHKWISRGVLTGAQWRSHMRAMNAFHQFQFRYIDINMHFSSSPSWLVFFSHSRCSEAPLCARCVVGGG